MLTSTELIEHFCLSNDLSSYDSYDIWNTSPGKYVKKAFYRTPALALPFAASLTLYDLLLNNTLRLGYQKKEYPVARALAALALMNLYKKNPLKKYEDAVIAHLEWLRTNYSKGYSGMAWGMNTEWISKNGNYPAGMPYITNTPYVLEAFIRYYELRKRPEDLEVIKSVYQFIKKDLIVQLEDEKQLALSYAPIDEKRIVVNSNSYALYAYTLCLPYITEKEEVRKKINKLFAFIKECQSPQGSWLYYSDNERGNFIDCFHTCFILKNILKSNALEAIDGAEQVVSKGYAYLKKNFIGKQNLAKRFAFSDKLSIVKYDLYDNAELLFVAHLMKDLDVIHSMLPVVRNTFEKDANIYSMIDFSGSKKNKNMLRWAVMPYLLCLSELSEQSV